MIVSDEEGNIIAARDAPAERDASVAHLRAQGEPVLRVHRGRRGL